MVKLGLFYFVCRDTLKRPEGRKKNHIGRPEQYAILPILAGQDPPYFDENNIWRGKVKENVGRTDQAIRAVVGPGLLIAGLTLLKGKRGRPLGLAAMVGGALISETAITRTCPLNELLGIDTSKLESSPASCACY